MLSWRGRLSTEAFEAACWNEVSWFPRKSVGISFRFVWCRVQYLPILNVLSQFFNMMIFVVFILIESSKLEKTFEITKRNSQPDLPNPITKPGPQCHSSRVRKQQLLLFASFSLSPGSLLCIRWPPSHTLCHSSPLFLGSYLLSLLCTSYS